MAIEYIERPPRIQPELPFGEVIIPKPPEKDKGGQTALLQMLVPMISVLGFVFASGTGNIGLVIPMGLAVVASLGVTLFQQSKEKRERAAKEKAYVETLLRMRQEMTLSHNTQRVHYHYNYPDTQTVLDIAAKRETSGSPLLVSSIGGTLVTPLGGSAP